MKKMLVRVACFVLGLFVLAFSPALAVNAALGVSPANALPYAVNLATGINLGACVTGWFCLLVLIEIAILRRDFKPIQVLQVLVATVFGFFVDFAQFVIGDWAIPGYAGQIVMTLISIFLCGVGISLMLAARLIPLPPEGLVLAMGEKLTRIPFHHLKVAFDCMCTVVGVAVSFFATGTLGSVREGTLLFALLLGKTIAIANGWFFPLMDKWCFDGVPLAALQSKKAKAAARPETEEGSP